MSVDINVSITEDQVDIIATPTLNIINVTSSAAISWGFINGTLSNQTDLQNALNAKQNTLVSGSNIKTLEGQSLLGSGNIDLTKSDVGLANVDNTSDANKPVSTATQTALNAKQDTLVSGTNIKTINGSSILGSGDFLTIPQLTTTQRDALTPVAGYPIYNTTEGYLEIYDNFWGWMPVASQNEWKRKWGWEYWNDFGSNNGFNDGVVLNFGAAAGVTTNPTPTNGNYIGLMGLRTGATTTGSSQIRTDVNIARFKFQGFGKYVFETAIFIRTLSTASDRYNVVAGDLNAASSTFTSGCAFVYDEGGVGTGTIASPNWQIVTATGGVRTVFVTSVVVSATTWYKFRLEVNENSTEVKYYINDILVRTETTNVPGQGSQSIQPVVSITKSAGTTDTAIILDYLGLKKKFTTAR